MSEPFRPDPFVLRFRRGRRPLETGTARPPGDAAMDAASRPLVLVIDGDAESRRFIAARLRRGHRVITAADGGAGLALARRESPDLILAAAAMPAPDGLELSAALAGEPATSGRIPLILITGRADSARLRRAGWPVDDQLLKPFSAAELLARTAAALRRRALARRLAESAARLDLIMDNVPAGIVLLQPLSGAEPDFVITAVNRNVNRIAGFSQVFLHPGSRLTECLRPAAANGMYGDCNIDQRIRDRMAWYASTPGETISSVFPSVDGRFVQATRSAYGDFGFLVVTVDNTEQVKSEQELQAACERAEGALEDLLAAQNRLVQAEKMASLGRLVAGVAHEINTPLGIAVTLASLFSEKVGELETDLAAGRLRRKDMERYIAGTREGCELLLANLQRAADLVQSFKQVAADQASGERRRFELNGWLSDIVVSLGPVWRKAGHRIEIACPEPIEIDGHPGMISQVVTNLVTNSIVHGFEPGQRGLITITATPVGSDTVEITYTDNGKGIARDAQDKVFDPFFTTRRSSGSTGLGLHIIYNLVVGKLGGSIDLASEEGRGVRFVLRFPRSPDIALLAEGGP